MNDLDRQSRIRRAGTMKLVSEAGRRYEAGDIVRRSLRFARGGMEGAKKILTVEPTEQIILTLALVPGSKSEVSFSSHTFQSEITRSNASSGEEHS